MATIIPFLPVGMKALRLIHAYLEASTHGDDLDEPLFRPVKNHLTRQLRKPLPDL